MSKAWVSGGTSKPSKSAAFTRPATPKGSPFAQRVLSGASSKSGIMSKPLAKMTKGNSRGR